MDAETLQFVWENTRIEDGDVRMHVIRNGKLMLVITSREAIEDRYKVGADRLIEALTGDRDRVEEAIVLKLHRSPPVAVYEPGGSDVFRHFLLILRNGDL